MTALGPGTTRTSMPSAAAARTSRKPGSETPGMPPSVTRATSSPSRSRFTICGTRWRSFPSKKESIGTRTSMPASRRPERRVSSAATSDTCARVSRARRLRSPRLPMGVPTTNRMPGIVTMLPRRRRPEPRPIGSPLGPGPG